MTRLLQLPKGVQKYLSEGKISIGHARALITADHADVLAKEIISRSLSVRQTEQLVAEMQGRPSKSSKSAKKEPAPNKDVDTLALEDDISNKLGMRVSVDSADGKSGKVVISFKSLDQLDDIIQRLTADGAPSSRLSS